MEHFNFEPTQEEGSDLNTPDRPESEIDGGPSPIEPIEKTNPEDIEEAKREALEEYESKQETQIKIGEIYIDEGLESILSQEEFTAEIQKINQEINVYLGENDYSPVYDFRIYSNREEYEHYLRTSFPDKFENATIDNATFHYDREAGKKVVIAKYIEISTLDPSNPDIQEYLKKEGITFDQLTVRVETIFKNNVYPAIAHEMAHLHPFFGGVGNEASENKWEQEMVCIFVDQKMWEKYSANFIEIIRTKAKEQSATTNFYEELVQDFHEGDFKVIEWERLFYPFLEQRYGLEKLQEFWSILFKDKADFESSFETVFGDRLKDAASLFQEEIQKSN